LASPICGRPGATRLGVCRIAAMRRPSWRSMTPAIGRHDGLLTRRVSIAKSKRSFPVDAVAPAAYHCHPQTRCATGAGRTILVRRRRGHVAWEPGALARIERDNCGRATEGGFSVTATIGADSDRAGVSPLAERLRRTRGLSLALAEPLS